MTILNHKLSVSGCVSRLRGYEMIVFSETDVWIQPGLFRFPALWRWLSPPQDTSYLLILWSVNPGVDLEAAKRLEEEQIMRDARTWLKDGPPANVQHPKTGATPLHVAAAKGYQQALKSVLR